LTYYEAQTIPADLRKLDDRFAGVRCDTRVERLFASGRWLEGPAYSVQGRFLLFSDVPNDRTLKLDEQTGVVSVFDNPSQFANGRTFDRCGRVLTCLHGSRCVVRLEHDGTVTTVASTYDGKRLNSPNDIVVDSRGSAWFTDPSYGLVNEYDGHVADQELDHQGVYRWSDDMSEPELVIADLSQPNGLAFSHDEETLFVVDSDRGTINAFDTDLSSASRGRVIIDTDLGFDGIRVDTVGRIWATTAQGVSCFLPSGEEVAQLALPERAINLCFGGPQRNLLYIAGATSLFAIRLSVQGAV
jgi:gluconolactonase